MRVTVGAVGRRGCDHVVRDFSSDWNNKWTVLDESFREAIAARTGAAGEFAQNRHPASNRRVFFHAFTTSMQNPLPLSRHAASGRALCFSTGGSTVTIGELKEQTTDGGH